MFYRFAEMCFCPQYKASKEGTVMGVAVSKISMLTHCQALTQACNYCEGQNVVLRADCVSFCLNYLFLKIPFESPKTVHRSVLSFLSQGRHW